MKKLIYLTLVLFIAVSCASEESDIEKLQSERSELKAKLTEIEAKIAELDTLGNNSSLGSLVSLEEVKLSKFIHQIDVQGNIETEKDALVNAESSGVIREILVTEGQRVSRGQILAQIDVSVISDNIEELNSSLEFAQYNYDKQKELFEKGVGSEFQLKQAKNNLDNLKNKLKGLKTQKGKYAIVAPFDGVIDQVFPKIGEMIGPQSPVVRLVNNKEVKVTTEISERLYNRVKEGTKMSISIPSLGDTIIQVVVSHVGNYIHPTNRTFRVQALIKNNKLLLPNMLAQVKITDYVKDEVLVIPSAAILKDRENNSYVFIAEKLKNNSLIAKRVDVNVIESYDGLSEIEAAELTNGTSIVVNGAKGITEGDIIRTK